MEFRPLLVMQITLALQFLGCSEWNQADVEQVKKLSKRLSQDPDDLKLRSELFKGMRSPETLKAVNYIHAGGDLAENDEIREEVVDIISDRIQGHDPWIRRACSAQLMKIVKYDFDSVSNTIMQALVSEDDDVVWFALESVIVLGEHGEMFTDLVSAYLDDHIGYVNPAAERLSAKALFSIGTNASLRALSRHENSQSSYVRGYAEKASDTLRSGTSRR